MLNSRFPLLALVATAWTLLSLGCAGLQPTETRPPAPNIKTAWEARLEQLSSQQEWNLKGRISVIREQEGFTAGLEWQQSGERYEIALFDPLGRKSAIIHGGSSEAVIETANGERASAADAESLMHQQLGWSAPLSSLRYWVLGIPDPEIPDQGKKTLDHYGRLASLELPQWTVIYPRYGAEEPLTLPQQIKAEGNSLKIKLLVKEWHLAP